MVKTKLVRMLTVSAAIMAAIVFATPGAASAAADPKIPVRTADLANCLGRPFTTNHSQSFTFNGDVYQGRGYAGHYSGLTAVPSTTQSTSAGIEAQCLLARYGDYNPGPIDGIFGSRSRGAMREFQSDMNDLFGAGLSEDGLPGPQSWRWLRWWEQ